MQLPSFARVCRRSIRVNRSTVSPRWTRAIQRTSLAERRFSLVLMALFAGLTLLLAAMGLYGTLAQRVAERSREIGVRLALGAAPSHVFRAGDGRGRVARCRRCRRWRRHRVARRAAHSRIALWCDGRPIAGPTRPSWRCSRPSLFSRAGSRQGQRREPIRFGHSKWTRNGHSGFWDSGILGFWDWCLSDDTEHSTSGELKGIAHPCQFSVAHDHQERSNAARSGGARSNRGIAGHRPREQRNRFLIDGLRDGDRGVHAIV